MSGTVTGRGFGFFNVTRASRPVPMAKEWEQSMCSDSHTIRTGGTPQASGILLGVTIAIICIAPAVGLCHAARVAFEPAQSSVPGSRDTHQALEIIQRRTGLLEEHLDRLRAIPAHGNRTLHIDQLFIGLLLAFFDPLARSLRTVADNGNFDGRLDIKRLARSTMSD